MKIVKKILAWSYSRFEVYSMCPAKAKYKLLDKIEEPSNKALDNGARIHDLAKEYVRGIRKVLPLEFIKFKTQFAVLLKNKAKAEQEWAFTKNWVKTLWNDWEDCWVRIKVDAVYVTGDTVVVVDYKTGKNKTAEYHEDQRSLYALGAFLVYPKAKQVRVEHWYLEHGPREGIQVSEYDRQDLAGLKKLWEAKVKPMTSDTRFAPLPGGYCSFCHYRNGNGGPCLY